MDSAEVSADLRSPKMLWKMPLLSSWSVSSLRSRSSYICSLEKLNRLSATKVWFTFQFMDDAVFLTALKYSCSCISEMSSSASPARVGMVMPKSLRTFSAKDVLAPMSSPVNDMVKSAPASLRSSATGIRTSGAVLKFSDDSLSLHSTAPSARYRLLMPCSSSRVRASLCVLSSRLYRLSRVSSVGIRLGCVDLLSLGRKRTGASSWHSQSRICWTSSWDVRIPLALCGLKLTSGLRADSSSSSRRALLIDVAMFTVCQPSTVRFCGVSAMLASRSWNVPLLPVRRLPWPDLLCRFRGAFSGVARLSHGVR